jgi:TM2 domain-containing membrane protein YozV
MAEVGAAEVMQFQQGMTDQQKMIFASQYNSERKDRTTALILSILLGALGVDRFYVGDTGIGILKLLTLGVCGIFALIDWFLIMGRADDYNRRKAQEIAAAIKTSA